MNEPFSIIPKTNMIKKNCTLIIFFRPLFIFCAASQPWLHWHGWLGWSGWLDLLPVCCPAWVAGVPVGVGGWRDWSPNCLPSRWALKKYSLIILSIFFQLQFYRQCMILQRRLYGTVSFLNIINFIFPCQIIY